MSREQSLRNGAGLMVFGALIFLVYAVVFLFRAFGSSGFEIGVETTPGRHHHWPIDRLPSLKPTCRREGTLLRSPDRWSQQPVPKFRVSPQGCTPLL